MTLRERYKSLSNPVSVKEMVVTSVFNSMHLEGQTVAREKLEKLYEQVKEGKSALLYHIQRRA